jgi:membrane associated rhomboid family serine protease
VDSSEPQSARQPIFNLPPATKLLLLANVAIHGLRMLLPARVDDAVVATLGFAADRYSEGGWLSWSALLSPFTYQFLHGSVMHLGVNMLGLVAFGSGVEQRLGPWRFLAFYLLCGVAGALAQFAVAPNSDQLLIGASAAISGVFGAIVRFRVAQQSFWIVVAVWMVMNVLAGTTGIAGDIGPVAWVAHIGGFVAGLILFAAFDPTRPGSA